MLVPVRTSGTKPPLYFIHGLIGFMSIGRFLAQALGQDQPFYCINANNIDSRGTTKPGGVKDMALGYVEEILRAQPNGPLLIGGMCVGGLAAIEVVRELQARGREVGPVILADPPTVPPGFIKQNQTVNPHDAQVAAQLYERVRGQLLERASISYADLPFEPDDQTQVHLATLAGVNSLVALSRHVPEVFPGATVMILSIAHAPGIFHTQMHWIKLLPQAPTAHVLPCTHREMFRSARHDFARVLKFVLEGAINAGTRAESAAGPTLHRHDDASIRRTAGLDGP
jgi:thioesterase domain-containing protein